MIILKSKLRYARYVNSEKSFEVQLKTKFLKYFFMKEIKSLDGIKNYSIL